MPECALARRFPTPEGVPVVERCAAGAGVLDSSLPHPEGWASLLIRGANGWGRKLCDRLALALKRRFALRPFGTKPRVDRDWYDHERVSR